jgi:MOSC domain-containing protein YiiM
VRSLFTVGTVEHIHIAAEAAGPMQSLDHVDAVAHVGLAGDRYATHAGFWEDGDESRDVTLVEAEAIEHLAAEHGIELVPGETRRNITTRGIELASLIGRHFRIGDVLAKGTDHCEPCTHLVALTGKPLLRPLAHRGGLRADLLSSGRIHVGDSIEVVEPAPEAG